MATVKKKKAQVNESSESRVNLAYAMEAAKARGDKKEAARLKKMLDGGSKKTSKK